MKIDTDFKKAAMFDTNVFNMLIDEKILLSQLPNEFDFIITPIQHEELNNTPNVERRNKLLDSTQIVDYTTPSVHTEWFQFNQTGFDHSRFISEEEITLKDYLLHNKNAKHYKDTLIILTAIVTLPYYYNQIILVSNDGKGAFKRFNKLLSDPSILPTITIPENFKVLRPQDFIEQNN